MTTKEVCPHGQLARSCELCERDARIAELEAALRGAERDAARYRKLKSALTVPNAAQAFARYAGWPPDTFNLGIDETIDAAINLARNGEGKE